MASNDTIRVACRRHDWTDALFDGLVKDPSFHLEFSAGAHPSLSSLFSDSPNFDFLECGLVGYVQAKLKGAPIKALPVFIRAAFRHSYIFVNEQSGIKGPKDLEGKRVGTRYAMTANVWARALLKYEYGVQLEKVRWINQEREADVSYNLPVGMILETVSRELDLKSWLVEGKIDALIHPDIVPSKLLATGKVKRLFPDAAEEERKSYRNSRIIPVMNIVAFREEDLRKRHSQVKAVFQAFCRAKEIGLDDMQDNRHSGLLWYWESLEGQQDLVGDDPAPYSVEKLRHTLEAFVSYAVEQGLIPTSIPLEELFVTGLDG
ncbi:MAG: ABC transporter substrate-binding protein [Candidatus Binatia bacterium]